MPGAFGGAYRGAVAVLARVAAVIAGAAYVYVVVGTALGVFYRYVLNLPSRFLFDSVEIAMGLTVFLSLAFVALRGGHVRMEVFALSRTGVRAVLDAVARVVSAVVLGAYAVVVFGQFLDDLGSGIKLGSNFGLPRWVPMLCLSVGLVLFALVLLRRPEQDGTTPDPRKRAV